jgi:predicted RNA-binding Zn ribbon-like protein
MSSKTFDLEAGALCLDFANTVDWHASENPQDRLSGYADLLAWGEAAGELAATRAEYLRLLTKRQPGKANKVFELAIRLRETIYRIFSFQAAGRNIALDDLAYLNELLGQSLSHLRITSASSGFSWDWNDTSGPLDQVLWPVVRSAAELLTSEDLDRVRECADDRGCGYLFLDLSRNRSRRWCSMETCGNRAKAQRHYRRTLESA